MKTLLCVLSITILSFMLVFGTVAPVFSINFPLVEIQEPLSEYGDSDLKVDIAKLDTVQIPFIQNQGQLNEEIKFYTSTFTGTFFVTNSELTYSINGVTKYDDTPGGIVIKEKFIDSNLLTPKGIVKNKSVVNYFIGEQENWRSNISTYDVVSFGMVWPSVDVELKAFGNNLEKIFYVKPGGNPNIIKIQVDEIKELDIDKDGKLLLETELDIIKMTKPIAYQNIDGVHHLVDVAYSIDSNNSYEFTVGNYDPAYVLVIDPLLTSTLLENLTRTMLKI